MKRLTNLRYLRLYMLRLCYLRVSRTSFLELVRMLTLSKRWLCRLREHAGEIKLAWSRRGVNMAAVVGAASFSSN